MTPHVSVRMWTTVFCVGVLGAALAVGQDPPPRFSVDRFREGLGDEPPALVQIEGRVVRRDGAGLAGAQVEVERAGESRGKARTDDDGRFVLDLKLRPGPLLLVAYLGDGAADPVGDRAVARLEAWLEAGASRLVVELVAAMPVGEGEVLFSAAPDSPSGGSAPPPFSTVTVYYATDRRSTGLVTPKDFYGSLRGNGRLEFGTCTVSIPRDHRLATLESPGFLEGEDPGLHVVLLTVRPETPDGFYTGLRRRLDGSARREAFVFVHGFNVSFEDGVRRTAQLAYDLQFDGPPIVYSWPSGEGLSDYAEAEANVDWAMPHFFAFLREVGERTGAARIHLIGHSMGNRLLVQALNLLALTESERLPLFHQVVLTAPDVDAGVFEQLAQQIRRAAGQMTLYASANDKALALSRGLHDNPRAGEVRGRPLSLPGIDTIDVSAVDTSFEGHSYYGESTSVVSDLVCLLRDKGPPGTRSCASLAVEGLDGNCSCLRRVNAVGGGFWRLEPAI